MNINGKLSENFITFGSIVSLMLDKTTQNEVFSLKYNDQYNILDKERTQDFFLSRQFLYSHGIFNDFCYFKQFADKTDIKDNYFNSLFLIIPELECDSLDKMKKLIKNLRFQILSKKNIGFKKAQIKDLYLKFKQEIQSNHDYSMKKINDENRYVNFEDYIQFMHIKSGKFLKAKKDEDSQKIYVKLTENMSQNTLFRFVPAYNYQIEDSSRVFFNLSLKIASGDKELITQKFLGSEDFDNLNNKKYLAKLKQINDENNSYLVKAQNMKSSFKSILDDLPGDEDVKRNLYNYFSNTNIPFKDYGKCQKPENNYIIIDEKCFNIWRIVCFSENYLKDNSYINSLDYFSIQNLEKNISIEVVESSKNSTINTKKNEINLRGSMRSISTISDNNNNNTNYNNRILLRKNKEIFGDEFLNNFKDEVTDSELNYELVISNFKENDNIKPSGLFKFEIMSKQDYNYNNTKIGMIKELSIVRIISVFTNKLLTVERQNTEWGGSLYYLKLIDNNEISKKNYNDSLFEIERMKEFHPAITAKDNIKENNNEKNEKNAKNEKNEKSDKNEKNESNDNKNINSEKSYYIDKNDFIKIKSKKYNVYFGIRFDNELNKTELVLSNSISDLSKFKLNFIHEIDKYELHFFEQLMFSFNLILNYFKKENEKNIKDLSYEHIQHILITFQNKIKIYKNNKDIHIVQENKFDFLKVIDHLNIVSKLVDIFLANWFHDFKDFDYNKMEPEIEKYFIEIKDECRSKLLISRRIIKILKLINNLDSTYLNAIQDKLIYFFMFAGRDDKCTKFLIHLLRDNGKLLISLCPPNNEVENKTNNINYLRLPKNKMINKYQILKKCLFRIIRDYNTMNIVKFKTNFSSIVLFFKLINTLLICNNKPFTQFYIEYFKDLKLLTNESQNMVYPNYNENPILVHFYRKDEKIFVRRRKFIKNLNVPEVRNYFDTGNVNTQQIYDFDLKELIDSITKNDIINDYNFILIGKLVSLNIILYCNLSLCVPGLKNYLKTIFSFDDTINFYLLGETINNKIPEDSDNEKITTLGLINDIKCSLILLLNYLYFRNKFDFTDKLFLFRCLDKEAENRELISNIDSYNLKEENLNKIINFLMQVLKEYNNFDGTSNDLLLLLYIFECIKYTIRNLYVFENRDERISKTFGILNEILKFLEKFMGEPQNALFINNSQNFSGDLYLIVNDELELKNDNIILSDHYHILFNTYKTQLEYTLKSLSIHNEKKFFLDLFKAAINEKQRKIYEKKIYNENPIKLLKYYDLTMILMKISLNSNISQKNKINEILIIGNEIVLELIKLMEVLSIDDITENIVNLSKEKTTYEINDEKVYDQFLNEIIHPNKDYLEMFQQNYINDINNDLNCPSISFLFFKFLYITNNQNLKNLNLRILYRLNSQKKLFYENITNLVLLDDAKKYQKFIIIKEIFEKMFGIVTYISISKRLDGNIYQFNNLLDSQFKKLINLLLDENEWRSKKNVMNILDKISNENDYYNNRNNVFNRQYTINSNKSEYFVNDFSDEKIHKLQQTLYNLDFVKLINEFFDYADWVIENSKEINKNLTSFESILVSIYKLLVIFFYDNNKHQNIIKEHFLLYICPLKLEVKTHHILFFIGYFVLNLIYFFRDKDDFYQIKNLDRVIILLNSLSDVDWKKYKKDIPYYVQIFQKFLEFSPFDYFFQLYQVLEKINHVLVNEILCHNDTYDDIFSITKIMELIVVEQNKKKEENRNATIISLSDIIDFYLNLINLLVPQEKLMENIKLCKMFTLVTDLLYDHFYIYKAEFYMNSIYIEKLTKTLQSFCEALYLTDNLIYTSSNNNINLKYFNEFLGITIPKLYILISFNDLNEKKSKHSEKSYVILETVDEFYQRIEEILEFYPKETIFIERENKEDIDDIIKFLGHELTSLENVKSKMTLKFRSSQSVKSTISKYNENELLKGADNNINNNDKVEISFIRIWDRIKMKINYRNGLVDFQNFVKQEINHERMRYIEYMSQFFTDIEDYKNTIYENKSYIVSQNDTNPSVVFYELYINTFKQLYGDYSKNKNEIYFFYWTAIFLMKYNLSENCFIENMPVKKNQKKISADLTTTPYNKIYFNDLNFIDMTINQFERINVFSNDYETFLFLHFLNCYFFNLDDEHLGKFFIYLIDQDETENIFYLLNNIIEELYLKITSSFDGSMEYNNIVQPLKLNYTLNLFENDLDKYQVVLKFLSYMSENNNYVQGKMKDYLRLQYNNSKNHNFIIILSKILKSFTNDSYNRNYIRKYYPIIIQIIECLTKLCNGPSKNNQDCIVKETQILNFIRSILKNVSYRPKKICDDGIDLMEIFDRSQANEAKFDIEDDDYEENENFIDTCNYIGLDRKRLAFLKFKLLLFLSVLTVGRKKGDKIFEVIHKIIDFDVLASVLIETYKEILIEKGYQESSENLIFDEDMLLRMNDFNYKNIINYNDPEYNKNFIIFEIGTYTYILINIYMENLTRPFDVEIYNKIHYIHIQLKKAKCEEDNKSIFEDTIGFGQSFTKCLILLCNKCGHCLSSLNPDEDFMLNNSFEKAYSFYFDYTPNIEVVFNDQIIKYYVKLSPMCRCLTKEMIKDFNAKVDRSSTKSKLEFLFNNIDYYQYQLIQTKKILDIFRKTKVLELLFNHYIFYRDIFLILGALLNILLFASLYRTNDDEGEVTEYSEDFHFDYGFLYKSENISITRNIFRYFTLIEFLLSIIILINYIFIRIPNLMYYKIDDSVLLNRVNIEEDSDINDYHIKTYSELRQNVNCFKKVLSSLLHVIQDTKLFYHIILMIGCLVALSSQNYRFLSLLLIDIIERSSTLMYIVKSFWLPKKQIIVTLILFYLIAYYFFIFVYLFLPDQLPTYDCYKFSDCYFTLCDQTIKNSNGIINYLVEKGLFLYNNLYQNPRFWIDNWFAIIDILLVLQMVCGIIIDTFGSQRAKHSEIEEDMQNICFICGLNKTELNKYYCNESGFYEHTNLDHYPWNYMFVIFNVTQKNYRDLMSLDQHIIDNYRQGIYSTWVPYKKCIKQLEKKDEEKEDEEESEES